MTEEVEYPDEDSMMECMSSFLSLWDILLTEVKTVVIVRMIHCVVEANGPIRSVSVYCLYCKP